MGTFLRGRHPIALEQSFVQGAGRILIAPHTQAYPDGIEDIIVLAAGATQYDAVTGWQDVGFTRTGINVTRNNAEEEFDVDQIRGSIRRRPTNWEMSVGTQLAEATLETFALAWELPQSGAGSAAVVTKVEPQLDETHIGLSAPTTYTERRVAVLFQFPDGIIRAWVFRRAFRAPQETGFTLNKTGEQVSLPIRWNCMADADSPIESQFGEIFEQEPAA
jgi:hypothetical protein